jgi:hypothetical protein
VWTRSRTDDHPFCFQVKGGKGYVTMVLPKVYGTVGDQRSALTAKVTVGTDSKVVGVKKEGWTEIGEGAAPSAGSATLLELRVTR